jgi:hypothetical protein
MKKQILLLFGLLLSHFVYSQTAPVGNYIYNASLSFGDPGHDCGCKNLIKLQLKFNDGDVVFIDENVSCRTNGQAFPPVSKIISANRKLNKIQTISSRNEKNILGCGNPSGTNDKDIDINITSHLCKYDYYDIMTYPATFLGNTFTSRVWYGNLSMTVTPQLTIIDPSNGGANDFEIDDPNGIVINSHSGFDSSDYNWEYLFPNIDPTAPPPIWESLSQFDGRSSINLKIEGVIGDRPNPKNYYGRILNIRQVACGYTSATIPPPNEIKYTLLKTPPLLLSTAPPEKTKCSYSTDGKIQFTFNRPLETDEKFRFNLKKLEPITNTYRDVVNSFDVVNTATNSQCTLKNLPPGKYQGTYYTIYPNPSSSVTTLNSKDKIIAPFEITTSPALKYTARMAQPKCATDGAEIVVNATGGTPPYSYSINGAPAVKYIDTDEKGLPKGDYIIAVDPTITDDITIQVTDKQNCVDDSKK